MFWIILLSCFYFDQPVTGSTWKCVQSLQQLVNNVLEGSPVGYHCVLNETCQFASLSFQRFTGDVWENAITRYENGTQESHALSNGVDYRGRSSLNPGYYFELSNTLLEDNGDWRCIAREDDLSGHASNTETMIINVNSSNLAVDIETPKSIVLGTPARYYCRCNRVFPNVSVSWILDGTELDNGTTTYESDDAIFSFENHNDFLFMNRQLPEIICLVRNTFGINWSEPETADLPNKINAPASIEDFVFPPEPPNPSSQLSMTCLVSGTDHMVSWLHDSFALDDEIMFKKNDTTVFGSFLFGETNATWSNRYWTLSPNEQSCSTLNNYNGVYKCKATALEGDDQESNEYDVTVQYSPILTHPEYSVIDSMLNETQSLTCEVKCASPAEVTYTWTSLNNRDGIDQDSQYIEIIVSEQDFDDNFTCTANNSIGKVSKNFGFNQIIVPTEKTTTGYPETTPDDGVVTTPKSDNTALIIANAVIWSLCGVVGIVLVCLALYHYRQIQNGRKHQDEYSEELILTDDEAKQGTSHTSDEYADIITAGASEGAVGVAVGGLTNDGLYAEVQTPSQTQMPVAPKRTSKVQASQPNPETPKPKRTQAPAAPKSPMNTRHEHNSPTTGRRPEPKANYSPVSKRTEIKPQHSNESDHGSVSKTEQQLKRHESLNKTTALNQTANGAKPSIPFKPNIAYVRSSRSSTAGAPYDNAEVNLYANCDQRHVQKNADKTVTYADLDLRKEDLYDEGAPPVPAKNMTAHEPVQYASIKHGK